jgi:ribonuclease P protein component
MRKEQRLRRRQDFAAAYRKGRTHGNHLLVLRVRPNGLAVSRFGFVTGKAVGNAVVRNRVKRRLRHVVKEFLADLPASSALVVRALPPAAGLDSAELRAELARCLQRVRRTPAAASARTGAPS